MEMRSVALENMTDKTELSIETLGGVKYLSLTINDGIVTEVTVDMGEPVLAPDQIPVLLDGERVIDREILVEEESYKITCVSVGNPHAVVFVKDTMSLPLSEIGPKFENHSLFPQRINTEFVEVLDRKTIRMRVWERGSGETFACGTGATASVYACILNGHTEDEVTVKMLGGDLRIRYDREKNRLYMTGEAVTVFEGTYF